MGCFDKITENNSFKTWDFTKSEAKWIWTFAIISWCTHVFCAVSATVGMTLKKPDHLNLFRLIFELYLAGPTRPYIALLFGVDVTSFSFLWTIESGGFTAGVLTGSMVFKRHFETRTMQVSVTSRVKYHPFGKIEVRFRCSTFASRPPLAEFAESGACFSAAISWCSLSLEACSHFLSECTLPSTWPCL